MDLISGGLVLLSWSLLQHATDHGLAGYPLRTLIDIRRYHMKVVRLLPAPLMFLNMLLAGAFLYHPVSSDRVDVLRDLWSATEFSASFGYGNNDKQGNSITVREL